MPTRNSTGDVAAVTSQITGLGFLCNGTSYCGTATFAAATTATATVATGLHGCQCTNTTTAAAVKCSYAGTTLSLSEVGSSSDAIFYACF